MKHYTQQEALAVATICGEHCSKEESIKFMSAHADIMADDVTIWDVYAQLNMMMRNLE